MDWHWRLRVLLKSLNPQASFGRALKAADQANARRDWPAAESAYADALRIDPLRADLWVQYGHALKEQGQLDRAASAYRRACDLAPDGADAFVHLGHLCNAQGRVGDAIAAFQRALAVDETAHGVRDVLTALGAGYPLPKPAIPRHFRDADDLPLRSRDGVPVPPHRSVPLTERLRTGDVWRDAGRRWSAALPAARRRTPTFFIHLHKTGGVTLDLVLGRAFAPERICPVKDDHLHLYSGAELDQFDFFSGHFDVGAMRLIGRPLRTISVFREPRARLVSFYRFHRGHDLGEQHGVNEFVQKAHRLSVEEFFEDPWVRRAPEVFNHYLAVFGLTYHQLRAAPTVSIDQVTPDVVAKAEARIRALSGIAILERFAATLPTAFRALGVGPTPALPHRNSTEEIARALSGAPPPAVRMTERLSAGLDDLVRFDEVLYAAAVDEAEHRMQERPAADQTAPVRHRHALRA